MRGLATTRNDMAYDGLINEDLSIFVEQARPPKLLINKNTSIELDEGFSTSYSIALTTKPRFDVYVNLSYYSTSLLYETPKLDIHPKMVIFKAGEALQWISIEVTAPYTPIYLGENMFSIRHLPSSLDPFYNAGDNGSSSGINETTLPLKLTDVDEVGVCLSSCLLTTQYDFLFVGDEDAVETPYEIIDGSVSNHKTTNMELPFCRLFESKYHEFMT